LDNHTQDMVRDQEDFVSRRAWYCRLRPHLTPSHPFSHRIKVSIP
jgi:hypothetical protein